MINISFPAIRAEKVSSSIIHQNMLLTYQILIEVIQIVAQIIICSKSLVLGLSDIRSSKKLTSVITAQNQRISHSL